MSILGSMGYPRFPLLRAERYQVGACLTRWDGCPCCQIYYPADASKGSSRSSSGTWFRPQLIERLTQFSTYLRPWMLRFLQCRPPHNQNAVVKTHEGGFPVIIFSHGLFGTLDMYKTLCGGLAASGFIVVALEHEDGSAMFAETQDGKDVPRQTAPKGFEYKRDNVIEFRSTFLAKRMDEVKNVLHALSNKSTASLNDSLVQDIVANADMNRLYMAGHSFGATACTLLLHEKPDIKFKGAVILDVWAFPLPRVVVDKGFTACPTLVIGSEQFANGKEIEITKCLVKNSTTAVGPFVIEGTAHQSFSDTPCLLPQWLGRRLGFCGRSDSDKVYQSLFDAIGAFLRHCESPSPSSGTPALEQVDLAIQADPLMSK